MACERGCTGNWGGKAKSKDVDLTRLEFRNGEKKREREIFASKKLFDRN